MEKFPDHDHGTQVQRTKLRGFPYWRMPKYGAGWIIKDVIALQAFPDSKRPVADAGGLYEGYEGSSISFLCLPKNLMATTKSRALLLAFMEILRNLSVRFDNFRQIYKCKTVNNFVGEIV